MLSRIVVYIRTPVPRPKSKVPFFFSYYINFPIISVDSKFHKVVIIVKSVSAICGSK